ncbi:MAG: tRNA 2-thiouridine(34) synthase MnmA [Anaerolineae bacterium]
MVAHGNGRRSGAQGQRVVVAMSGGVDSSVSALLLHQKGYEVVGVMLRLWGPPGEENRCCSPEAAADARRICDAIGAPFYMMNVEQAFERLVVRYMVEEYAAGRTPNPCLQCNRHIRFDALLKRARALGAEYLATGHYARVRRENGRYQLLKGRDPAKDQSYVLYMLGQRELAQVLFPVGDQTKDHVRELAREHGLPVADKSESQELCFVPNGSYARFLETEGRLRPSPGPILDRDGNTLGEHGGLWRYTVGQRRGLGVSAGEPLYIVELDAAKNALVVGPKEALGSRALLARDLSYVRGAPPEGTLSGTARIRYRSREAAATLEPMDENRARLVFEEPQRAVTPGQGVVFYQGDAVVGGGIIDRATTA